MFLSLDLAFDSDDLLEIFPILRTLKEGLRRIEQVLQFTREYDTFADAHSTWLNLHAIIESLKNEVDFGSISFEDTVPENLEIFADLLIVKAFRSIFDNAIRHGKTLTQVYFSVQEQEGDLLIVCADDGIGIPREEKEAIFSYGHGKNTGIGLFLAREILKLNGCTIQEAGVETKGSRFEIRVPEKRWRIQERDIRN
jgi:signal transduction histidine kinase